MNEEDKHNNYGKLRPATENGIAASREEEGEGDGQRGASTGTTCIALRIYAFGVLDVGEQGGLLENAI